MRYGKYELLLQQIGDPEWPFGSTHARLVLKDESGIITKYPFYVLNIMAQLSRQKSEIFIMN